MAYNYTNGDGVSVLLPAEPNGATEPISNLDNAIRQIKAFLNDPIRGIPAIESSLATVAAGNRDFFSAYSSANQSVSAATETKLNMTLELVDQSNRYTAASSRFTAGTTGWYRFNASIRCDWLSAVTPLGLNLELKLKKNGTTTLAIAEYNLDDNVNGSTYPLIRVVNLTAGDYVELYALYTLSSGTCTLQVTADANKTVFQGLREI